MKQSSSIKNLAAAMLKVQAEPLYAVRGSDNPYFKSKYADLPEVWRACRVALTNAGIAVFQAPVNGVGSVAEGTEKIQIPVIVETTLIHVESGEWMTGEVVMVPIKNDPQAIGSCITYGRRYGLATLAGVVSPGEDDDGNAASQMETIVPELAKGAPKVRSEEDPSDPSSYPPARAFDFEDKEQRENAASWAAEAVWRNVVIPFGKDKGVQLGTLPKAKLWGWWINFTPKPFNGRISKVDMELRQALDLAGVYYNFTRPTGQASQPEPETR